MTDQQTEHLVTSQRARHVRQARAAATRIQDKIAEILRDMDADTMPDTSSLVPDAVELEKRFAALEAIRDTTGIYEADGR